MSYDDLSDNKVKHTIDLKQTYDGYLEARMRLDHYKGGMMWKKSGGNEYLVKVTNTRGGNKSLGVRSAQTEQMYDDFHKGKDRAKERLSGLKEQLKEQSNIVRAINAGRVPKITISILSRLNQEGLIGKNLIVIGTNAIYAYEAVAGVSFESKLMETRDIDFLWDSRTKLKICSSEDDKTVLSIIQKADKTFEKTKLPFQASNKGGFMVDIVRVNEDLLTEPPSLGDSKDEFEPVPIPNLEWLLSSPKFEATVIGVDGTPAKIVAPDPRAFALHKLWLSEQPDRDPAKKNRDRGQALAVIQLVQDKFPFLKMDENFKKIFPKTVFKMEKVNSVLDDWDDDFDL